ncbi:hypothetical protein PGTUg99_022218 [Puccinia graminis f. sp. tritici]|uniref:Uncharacterized protein n=1 Tax=Puccinia graminis f. sp. tritici TaxID=56615 RepID=A0A5B0QRN2_PUCGR|nr:hypothetical protein PGTUg99_022218 [Puccinia graminis f. sp. tritici]
MFWDQLPYISKGYGPHSHWDRRLKPTQSSRDVEFFQQRCPDNSDIPKQGLPKIGDLRAGAWKATFLSYCQGIYDL